MLCSHSLYHSGRRPGRPDYGRIPESVTSTRLRARSVSALPPVYARPEMKWSWRAIL